MMIHDVSEVLLSHEKFKQLYEGIQDCYDAINQCKAKIRHIDTLLGTAVQDSIRAKQSQQRQLEAFERGFGNEA